MNGAMAGNDHLSTYKIVIVNDGMVADVVTAPEGYVVADLYKGLDGIVLKNKTIISAWERAKIGAM